MDQQGDRRKVIELAAALAPSASPPIAQRLSVAPAKW
jgi:hypothetical protein